VKCSPALKWFLALLLPLTLGWKLALRPSDPTELKDAIAEFLTQNHFNVVVTGEAINDMYVIEASSAGCRVLVAKILALRDSIDQVQHLARPNDRTFIVFGGMTYDKQPVFLTIVNYLWFRFLVSLGLASHIPPVFAVVSSCDVEQLPWSALRFI
jgi:hypothetical protein